MTESVVQSRAEIVVDSTENLTIRVLQVDDELDFLNVAKECLEMQGPFQVHTANCVEEALEKLKTETFDVIVSDYKMPGKDGLEFLKEVRQSGNTIPFLIFTGKGREEVAVEALNLGADQYLNKTGDPKTVYCELSHAIWRTVERRKAETALRAIGERYRRLFESAVEGIVINGADGRILSLNQAAARMLGYEKPEDLIGRPATELYADPTVRPPLLKELMEKGALKDRELIWKKKDGTLIQVLASITVQKDEKGQLLQTEGIVRDVTEKKRAERALAESEEKYRVLVEGSLQGIVIAQASNQGSIPRIVFANNAMSKFLGYTPEEMTSFSPQQTMNIVHPEDRELFFGRLKDRLEGRSAQLNYEVRGIRKDGAMVWLELSSTCTEYNGQPAVQATFIDITARKKIEIELRESEEKHRELVDQLPVIVYEIDLNGRFTFVSEKAFEITGYSREDFEKGLSILQMVVDKDLGKLKARIQKALCGEKIDYSEYTVLRKDGSTFPAMACANAIVCEGKIVGLRGIVTDITERKKAEEKLIESEERFKTLMEEAPIGVCNADLNGKITYVNKRFEELIGYSREEIVGKNGFTFGIMSEEASRLLAERMKDLLMGEPNHVIEGRFKRKDGEWMWAEIEGRVVKKLGVPVGFQLAIKDITERKGAEEERKRFEESLSALNTYGRDLAMAKSIQEVYELTLGAAKKTLGFEFIDIFIIEGKMLRLVSQLGYSENSGGVDLSLELPLDGDQGITVRVARTGKPVLVPDVSKDSAYLGDGLDMRSKLAVPIIIGREVVGVLNAERKEVNAFDEKDQQLLEILASHTATAISNLKYAKNLEVYANEIRESQQKFEGLFMASPEAAVHVGSDFRILNVNPRFEILFGYKLDEIEGRNINDVIVPKDKIDEAQMLDLKAEQDKHVSQATIRRKKDGSLVPVSVSSAPITVEGRLLGYVAVYKDISELKNTEKKLGLMNEKLRVTGGLTRHDVRNKLSTVTGNVYLLEMLLTENSDALDKLKAIESAVQQATRIFDFAKAYEMLGVEELSYIDTAKTLDEAVSLFPGAINVKIVNEIHGLIVLADPLLRQLFYNLIDNSLKYGQRVSRIRVYYEGTGLDNLRLVYEDDGVGIPAAEKPKLFIQGYSTGSSTGYGLYLISKIVEVYGWTIQETGTPGKGVQFTITIPKINRGGKESVRLS
jgi:PAS domain S-box-containing protein